MPSRGAAAPRLVWLGVLCTAAALALATRAADREWLAGDSHIHSHWSAGYDHRTSPPTPIKGRDAMYSTPRNAAMARRYGLRWMVTTDHGGPNHAKLNLEQAYRELTLSRELVPEVLQFYGMELNMPGMDHHTLIIPRDEDEASVLHEIESRFDANEDWARPPDPRRQSAELRRRGAGAHAGAGEAANPVREPSLPVGARRSVVYGRDEPWELRENNDLAPDVYRGMEGAPGHQAATLTQGNRIRNRGAYGDSWNAGARTLGGFDQMTAIVGGLWDALLGEGRRFWIVASSDSHFHYTEPVTSRERLLARRVPQDLGPRAPDLRRRPQRPSGGTRLRRRRRPRHRARRPPEDLRRTGGGASGARCASRAGRKSPQRSGSATRRHRTRRERTPPSAGST